MSKKGIVPVVLVMIVGLAGLAVLILGTIEFVHSSLTGAHYADTGERFEQARAYLPTVIVKSSGSEETLENCILIPTARPSVHILRCQ